MPSALTPLLIAATATANAVLAAGRLTPADASAGAITLTLPAPSVNGRLVVEKTDASTNTVTLSGSIRGATSTIVLVWRYESVELISNGTTWFVAAGHKTKASLDAAYAAIGSGAAGAIVAVTGLSASVDNTALINAALAAAKGNGASAGGRVRLPRGEWPIAGRVALTNGQRLEGESSGGSGSYGGTSLLCTAAGAGVDVTGDGGGLSYLEIDGGGVAQQPMFDHTGADRLHLGVDVHDSAAGYDNWLVEYLQNSNFISCTANRPGRDGLVLDKECGGILFDRFNVSDPTRYAVRIQQSVAPTTAYTTPSHLRFEHPLWERPKGNYPLLSVADSSVFNLYVEQPIMSGANVQTSAPLAQIGNSNGFVGIGWGQWSGTNVAGQCAIIVGSGSHLTIDSTHWMVNVPVFLDNSAGATVQMNGYVFRNGAKLVTDTTAANGDNNVIRNAESPIAFARPTSGNIVLKGRSLAEAGERFRMFTDGRVSWGDGTGYSFPASLYRRNDGKMQLDGPGLVVAGQILSQNAVPITTVSASATLGGGAVFGAVHSTSATAVTLTVPANASEPFYGVGSTIEVVQYGAGQVTIAAASGVTIRTAASYTTRAQYSSVTLRKIGSDEWLLSGDLT